MKTCFKGGISKPLSAFYRHPQTADGHLNKCKECARQDVAANYRANRPQYAAYERLREQRPSRKAAKADRQRSHRAANPEKDRARRLVQKALRVGRITKQPCNVCGGVDRLQAHHTDYSRPLDIVWLCYGCHLAAHDKRAIELSAMMVEEPAL